VGRSIPSFALVFALLLGLGSRVGTIVVHSHAGGDEAHHHGDVHYVGYVDHDHVAGHRHDSGHGHDHDAPAPHGPTAPTGGDDSEHSHYVAGDGPIVRRSGPTVPAAISLDVFASDAVGLALSAPSTIVPIEIEERDAPPRHALWPPGSTIERRLGGLGLLL